MSYCSLFIVLFFLSLESSQTLELMEKIASVFGKPLKNKGDDLQDEDDDDEEENEDVSSHQKYKF